jgi:hypothetical protein
MPLELRRYAYQVVFKSIETAKLFSGLENKFVILGHQVCLKTFLGEKI